MFTHTSRYYGLPTLSIRLPDGRTVKYAARRIVPQPATLATLATVAVTERYRLDRIAAATLGAPDLFWQVCDANGEANPFELSGQVGAKVRVPSPQPQ